ncbi:MAG TPA: hypothetical protein VIY48_05675 [Candidatus Paceibacterota bacterium]
MLGAPIYNYIYRPLPQAGAQQYAFEPRFTLPLYTLPGPGTPVAYQWNVTQPEQLWFNQSQVMDGIIGIQAGTLTGQPLVDTRGVNG